MPPNRRVRATASPSPAPNARAGTPARDPVTGRLTTPARGGAVRADVPAKYSTAYGSPITQLPDRKTVGGGGNITKAAAEIFSKVKKDNLAAEVRRRDKDQARATKAAKAGPREASPSPVPPTIRPTIEMDDEPEEMSDAESEELTSSAEESEYEDDVRPRRATPRKPLPQPARKRAHDDTEAEARAEEDRKARDVRLRRERSAEARKLRDQKLADTQKLADAQTAARVKAQQEQRARDAAARAAMPPPPPRAAPLHPPEIIMTPATHFEPADLSTQRPPSARSFIEEGNLFVDADISTPSRPALNGLRGPKPPASAAPSRTAPVDAAKTKPSVASPPQPASPPSVLKRPPRRPGGLTPGPRADLSSSPDHRGATSRRPPAVTESPGLSDGNQRQQSSPSSPGAASSFVSRLRHRFRPRTGQADSEEKLDDRPPAAGVNATRQRWHRVKQTFNPWSMLKIITATFVMLHAIRLAYSLARPDLFETPVLTLNWHGWKDWSSNIGQFFPSPLLHPLGVLTNDQYDDLKAYLQQRTTTTEAVVNNLKSIIPKVVSVRKDKKGRILVADEFWNALKDRIEKDSHILTLDGKSQVSEKHWKAIQQRLKDAGLLVKPLTADDVTHIVDEAAPRSWEKWLQRNERKVAELLGRTLGKDASKGSKGTDETVVSRNEFIRELTDQLAKNKKELTTTMESLRQELFGLVHEVKTTALAGGMTKADINTLIKEIVDKEISRRYLGHASQSGSSTIDAALRSRINHFSPGNGAQADVSLSSPAYKLPSPRIGSKDWLKTLPRQPQFFPDPLHALTSWSDPGQCWCAGTLGDRKLNRTHPATLAVRLPAFVVPQYVVLEHIDPGATADAGAMPRDVEVWAVFDEHGRRERMLDWMAVQFPGDSSSDRKGKGQQHPLLAQGLVKIGQFRYEHRAVDGGVVVHKLADELVEQLGAATDLVVVRAVTNHGAEDHTCFYRVRMYGEVVDLEAERKSKKW